MKTTYHGHSCLTLKMENGQRVMTDPFITGNPLLDLTAEGVGTGWLLITHEHSGHIGDMISTAKESQATIISIAEIASYTNSRGVGSFGMNIGGKHVFPFGAMGFVHAQHNLSYEVGDTVQYMGESSGIIIQAEGKAVYHAEGAAYFGGLGLLVEEFDIDVVFLPIGDNYTVGPEDAARTAQTIRAKKVVPIHFNTFPVVGQDPGSFMVLLEDSKGEIMGVSETLEA